MRSLEQRAAGLGFRVVTLDDRRLESRAQQDASPRNRLLPENYPRGASEQNDA